MQIARKIWRSLLLTILLPLYNINHYVNEYWARYSINSGGGGKLLLTNDAGVFQDYPHGIETAQTKFNRQIANLSYPMHIFSQVTRAKWLI